MLPSTDIQKKYNHLRCICTFTKTPEIFIGKKFTCSGMLRKRDQRRNSQTVNVIFIWGPKNRKGKWKTTVFHILVWDELFL